MLMERKLILIFSVIYGFIELVNGQWGNWNWNAQQPQVPNNNVGIGYPTAYGLFAGRGGNGNNWNNGWNENNGGGGPPNAGTGFGSPLRCLNGGAHIGQCRLDKDSICIALGGTCTHGACCTTPFVSILGVTSTAIPDVIDGEATKRKSRITTRKMYTTTEQSRKEKSDEKPEEEEDGDDVIDSKEMEEWNKLIERARTSTTQIPTTTTYEMITVTPTVEENENRRCESGLRPVGPCGEDSDCPTLHQCENEQCCYLTV